jgi:MoCo/4Fe-4S cofactor protein with predicted Tat translocation signal
MGERLKGKTGRRYWKALEQLAETPEFQKWVDDEFPHRSTLLNMDRRSFIKFMGAGMMLAGLSASGCRKLPEERLVPFVAGPEDRLAGKAVYYSSIANLGGYAMGVKVKTNEGRPVKLDGNPNHPASLGALDAKTQARILDLYDPDRLRMPIHRGESDSWKSFLSHARKTLDGLAANGGSGIALVTEAVGSPTMRAQIAQFRAKYPLATWVQHEPANSRNASLGATNAFGTAVDTVYDFSKARVVLSLDSNVMMEGPGAVRYQHDIMAGRDLSGGASTMNRIYAVECAPTTIGVVADHRVPLRASQVPAFAKALAGRLGVSGVGSSPLPTGFAEKWMSALVADLLANRGSSAVVTGAHQSADVHALVQAINAHLGNFGQTVSHIPTLVPSSGNLGSLVSAMDSGQVQALFILGANPVYSSSPTLGFAEALKKVPFKAQLSTHDDETGAQCDWQLPLSHFLEAWGDGVAFDGTAAIQQPTIEPLYDSKSEIEFLDALVGNASDGMSIVQSTWRGRWTTDFEKQWQNALASGVIAGKPAPLPVTVAAGLVGTIGASEATGTEIVLMPDPTVHDGRFANNGWLQELPKPISNLTWDNAAFMSHSTATQLGVKPDTYLGFIPADRDAELAAITVDGQTVEAAVNVIHGMADGVVLLHLGYGRTRGGQVLLPLNTDDEYEAGGFSAYRLFRADQANPWIVSDGVRIELTSKTYSLANAQFHNTIDMTEVDSERELLEEMTLSKFLSGGEIEHYDNPSLYDTDMVSKFVPLPETAVEKSGFNSPDFNQWAMTIDLTLCTGCNACVVACQSENNIPTVGKYQVQRGREMHWIRIDRYYAGSGEHSEWPTKNPDIRFQPVTCMHCENAPCEPVCPVAATTHSKEGINQMVYNRCVGTRYCSNNCPYKVRRFNFLNYANHNDVPVKLLLNNPDVTVRGRGVMEKCTYCVQRINHARIDAKKRGERIKDGEVTTACMDACPSRAIVFGDMVDVTSKVSQRLADKRSYKMLDHELNTKPRTRYLARVTNPNQEIEA